MGTFSVDLDVGDAGGRRWERVRAAVDTGASYTTLPREVLERLGVRPAFQRHFRMADERRVALDVAETQVRLGGESHTTLVVFADDPSTVLLGAHTLEAFSLAVDPVNQRLVPVEAWLLRLGRTGSRLPCLRSP
jgi:clan AA aspartic protease